MAQNDGQSPPPGFMDGPQDYDLEEMIHISRLESSLHRLLEQILSLDPNGMMRIEMVLHRVKQTQIVEQQLH